jgi:hypothetical protein
MTTCEEVKMFSWETYGDLSRFSTDENLLVGWMIVEKGLVGGMPPRHCMASVAFEEPIHKHNSIERRSEQVFMSRA